MSTISGADAENGWPARIETVVHQAMGVLMLQGRSVAEASASLDEMAVVTGRDVRAVAVEVVRSTRLVDDDGDEACPTPVSLEHETDVEVLVDDTWWPGYLYRHDWRKTSDGHLVCLVRFTTRAPDGRMENRASRFDEEHIRPHPTTP